MILDLEKQVCSLESSKRLKELGAPQESLFYYTPYCNDLNGKKYGLHLVYCEDDGGTGTPFSFKSEQSFSAYTVAELGEFLPNIGTLCYTSKLLDDWACLYAEEHIEGYLAVKKILNGATEAEARALMLIYLLENKLMKFEGKEK